MKKSLSLLISSVVLSFFALAVNADAIKKSAQASKPKLENLLKAKLARVENTEVIVSHVSIPPNSSLPTHWHPGEEFAYIIKGSVTLSQKGKADITSNAGDAVKIPLKQIHSARTNKEGAVILVFRVHETGQPERILIK